MMAIYPDTAHYGELWPVWYPTPNRPWQLYVVGTNDVLRKPPADGKHEAYCFRTVEQAWKFGEKYLLTGKATRKGK
jgi:hypothetical protein